MRIKKIVIGGFANIESVNLDIDKFNGLVALNNYGKSNIISAIGFGLDFIRQQAIVKNDMMAYKPVIPINKHIDSKPFHFEITFTTNFLNEEHTIIYAFKFDWIKNDKHKGQRIKEELLKIKVNKVDSKFKTIIRRNLKEAFYLPSLTGRCDKKLLIQKDELVVNKLKNFDDLFYLNILNLINALDIINIDTLQNPDKLFRRIPEKKVVETSYSLSIPKSTNVAFFIYSLKELRPDLFELFKDSLISLLTKVEDFEPVEIDLKKSVHFKGESVRLPLNFPEKIYDIRVKEVNNNQQTSIASLSSGSQKLFYVLALAIAAEINKIPLITFEELENSIHPGLLQKLLIILDGIVENAKIIFTSHSPHLIQYLEIDKIKIGIPNEKGLAMFSEFKKSKFKKAINIASEEGVAVGDLIFDKMIEYSKGESEFFNEMCN